MASTTEPMILTVGQLNAQIRDVLSGTFRGIWVGGEISDLSRPRSGHLYFSLKDPSGTLKAISWRSSVERLGFEPEDGMQVRCCGDVDVYPPRGTYQLIVRSMQLQGEGILQAQLRQLHARLAAEGLFAADRKRPLPPFPRRLAVVTSASGAALRDFLEVVRRRWAHTDVLVIPSDVQGSQAAPQLAQAIRCASSLRPLDAVLVTRGGGSLEDLWAFNDERVVRAIHESTIPVVSAVGHEIDVTLADLVADVRALTPSEAGERLVPEAADVAHRLEVCDQRMSTLLQSRIAQAATRLEGFVERRVLRSPYQSVQDRARGLDEWQRRARHAMVQRIQQAHQQLTHGASKLEVLSPLRVLARGYSVTQTEDGTVVRSAKQLAPNDRIKVRLSQGQVLAVVHSHLDSKETKS